MSEETTEGRIRDVGARLNSLVLRTIAALVVLVIFAGLAFLVFVGKVESDALLLFAGVILGYIIHATREAL